MTRNLKMECLNSIRKDSGRLPFFKSVRDYLEKAQRFVIEDLAEFNKAITERSSALGLFKLPFPIIVIEATQHKEENNLGLTTLLLIRQAGSKIIGCTYHYRESTGTWHLLPIEFHFTGDKIIHKYRGGSIPSHVYTATMAAAADMGLSLGAVVVKFLDFLESCPNKVVLRNPIRENSSTKKPLKMDSYHELILTEKVKTESVHLGGTHASPRMHHRRGYWRTSKFGVKHWVGPTIVNPSAGAMVVKDYVISTSSAA